MQHSSAHLAFLGQQVAEGKYVRKTTFFLSLLVALLVGGIAGNMLGGARGPAPQAGTQREFNPASPIVSDLNSNKDLINSILQHEEDVRKDPTNVEAWTHLGDLYYDTNQPAKAVQAYEKSLALKPGNTSAWVDCGVMYRELKEYDKALEYFKKALSLDPKHEIARFNTGVVLFHDLNRKDEGIAIWKELLAMNPNAKAPSGQPLADILKNLK